MTSTPLCEFVGLLVSPTGVINNLTQVAKPNRMAAKKGEKRKKREKKDKRNNLLILQQMVGLY
jgi:hypothetical protein